MHATSQCNKAVVAVLR